MSLDTWTENSLSSWLSRNPILAIISTFLLIITGALVLGTVILLVQGQFDQAGTLAGVASAFATILLVFITATYAVSTHQLVRQNQIDRHRDTVIGIVGRGIDTINDIINTDASKFNQESVISDEPPLPNLKRRNIPDKVIQDITRQNQSLGERYAEYRSLRQKYRNEWQNLKGRIEEILESNFSLSNGEMPLSAVLEDLLPQGFERTDFQFNEGQLTLDQLIQKEATALTYYLLENGPPLEIERHESVTKPQLAGLVFEEYRDAFFELRQVEEVHNDIERLTTLRDEMARVRQDLHPKLEKERERLMRTYTLLESEIPEPNDPLI